MAGEVVGRTRRGAGDRRRRDRHDRIGLAGAEHLAVAGGGSAAEVRGVVLEAVAVVVHRVRADGRDGRIGLVIVGRRGAARIERVVGLAIAVVVHAVVAGGDLAGPRAGGALAREAGRAGERTGLGEHAL